MPQISVNASIISDSGGTCVCSSSNCATDPAYLSCIQEVKQDLITGTAAIAALASVLMGALANLPVGMAPGMGLNAYVCCLLDLLQQCILTNCNSVHVLCGRLPRFWVYNLPGSSCCRLLRRVRVKLLRILPTLTTNYFTVVGCFLSCLCSVCVNGWRASCRNRLFSPWVLESVFTSRACH